MSNVTHAVVSCHFDRDPRSEGYSARPHGRVEVASLLIKALLCLVFVLASKVHAALLIAVVCIAAVMYVYGYYIYLP